MRVGLAWRYAWRSLWRGGQRTMLAIFCIAVGVLAIVALQLVGLSIDGALTGNIVEANGGDLRVDSVLVPFHASDLATFDQLRASGQITDYATTYETPSLITRADGHIVPFELVIASPNYPLIGQADFTAPSHDLRVQSIVTGDRIAVNTYVAEQLGAHLGDRFTIKTGDGQVVTATVAAFFQDGGAFHGPQVIIARAAIAAASTGTATAQYTTVTLTVPAAGIRGVQAALRQQFTTATVTTAADELALRQRDVDAIRLFLRIVGLLALFIGGVGIINTMQVLLRRRRVEIAMLKTMGYLQRDLYRLFGLEAALLGLLGSLLGTALGLGAAYLVRSLVEGAFFLHLHIPLDWPTLASGIGIGVLTALIFGLVPIAQASRVRPIAVLRDDAGGARLSWLVTGMLFALLSLLFVGLSTLILQDIVTAALVVYGGIALVLVMAGGFGALVALIARLPVYERPRMSILLWLLPALLVLGVAATGLSIAAQRISQIDLLQLTGGISTEVRLTLAAGGLALLLTGGAAVYALATLADALVMFAPRGAKTAIMLAYRNMGRQRARTTATLTALFVGVFAIGMILILGQGIKDTINNTLGTLFAHNVFVVTTTGKEAETLPLLNAAPGVTVNDTVASTVTRVRPTKLAGRDIADVLAELGTGTQGIGKRNALLLTLSIAQGYRVGSGNPHDLPDLAIDYGRNLAASDAGTGAVVVNDLLRAAPINLREGDTITVTDPNGTVTRTLTVVGFFSRSRTTDFVPGEIIGDTGDIAPLGGTFARDIYLLKADPQQIPALRTYLDQHLPSAQVVSITDLNQIIDRILNNLIVMLTAIASLALVAGLIIIANAVALAMLERRREIGILKSVGHTSRSILAMVLIENGLVGVLGALVALLLVVGAVLALSTFLFHVTLAINAPLVGGILALTVGVTLLIAALVAWGATRLRPLEVLRYE